MRLINIKSIRLIAIVVLCLNSALTVYPQEWYKVHRHYNIDNHEWAFPYDVNHISKFDFSSDQRSLQAHPIGREDDEWRVLFSHNVIDIDSVTFADDVAEELQTHNQYKVFTINIYTENGAKVDSKEEYVNCYVSVNGEGEYDNYSAPARIRGRGNSTWAWYDKKPYRLKLDEKHKLLGLGKNRDWVLLANYRDPTDLMNAFMFEVARWMGMPYVNHTRFVEVFLNNDYIGLYQLTEQVEQGGNRVDIAADGGILLAMDLDDGPDLSPDATDNFWSKVYGLPMCVKYPDEPDAVCLDTIRTSLAELEKAIKAADYEAVDQLMDIRSLMVMTMLQEFAMNVELCAPRSVFMYKDAGGKWAMGPFWDWDAGFDFDWSDMYNGHGFFDNIWELILGKDPANRRGMYGSTPYFFTDMFKNAQYVAEYKDLWNSVADSIVTRNWAVMEKYMAQLSEGAYDRDAERWPIDKYYYEEINRMKSWLDQRTSYLTDVINAYPSPKPENEKSGVKSVSYNGNSVTVYAVMDETAGYSQSFRIELDADKIASELGTGGKNSHIDLVPLNADGSVGKNTAAGEYGAWFSGAGNTVSYSAWGFDTNDLPHVFIESNDLYSWSCGLYPDRCVNGDYHTVRMRYLWVTRNGESSGNNHVDVTVNFTIK